MEVRKSGKREGRWVVRNVMSVGVKIGSWKVRGKGCGGEEEEVVVVVVVLFSRMDRRERRAASCHDEFAAAVAVEVEDVEVKLPRPRHIQFLIRFFPLCVDTEGIISPLNNTSSF